MLFSLANITAYVFTAHYPIAIGAGTDVAIETADVFLVNINQNDILNILKFLTYFTKDVP